MPSEFAEILHLRQEVEGRGEEIARLRGELSRAAVRVGEMRRLADDAATKLRRRGDAYAEESRKKKLSGLPAQGARWSGLSAGSNDAAAVIQVALSEEKVSPLSDATQEVLEAAVEVRNHASKEPPVKTSLVRAMIALHDAVDRYLALLEGRDRKEG